VGRGVLTARLGLAEDLVLRVLDRLPDGAADVRLVAHPDPSESRGGGPRSRSTSRPPAMSPGGLFAGESDRTVGTGPRSAADARRQPAGPPSNSRPTAVPHTASSSTTGYSPARRRYKDGFGSLHDPRNRRAMLRAP